VLPTAKKGSEIDHGYLRASKVATRTVVAGILLVRELRCGRKLVTKVVAELNSDPNIGRAETPRRSMLSMIDGGSITRRPRLSGRLSCSPEKAELDNADVGFALADMASIFDEVHAFERRRR
jgi:hypothetical protein